MKNSVKAKLKKGEATFGSWMQLAHPAIAEIMVKAGCEWVALDMEHSSITLSDAGVLLQVIEAHGAVPLVRLPENDPMLAKRLMDCGAYGIIVPMVNTKEDAERAVAGVKYPPMGTRGVGLYRAQEFGSSFDAYFKTANKESLVIVQIEHKDGVENIDEIVSVPGVDGVFIGPYDLSCSLGIPGEINHPLVEAARKKVVAAAKKAGVALGSHVVPLNPAEMKKRRKEGYTFLAYTTDAIALNTVFREGFKKIQE